MSREGFPVRLDVIDWLKNARRILHPPFFGKRLRLGSFLISIIRYNRGKTKRKLEKTGEIFYNYAMNNPKEKKLTDILLFFLTGIVIVSACGLALNRQGEIHEEFIQEPEPTQIDQTEPEPEQEVKVQDWTLSIPSIGLFTPMEEIHTQGREIPVPENNPGYLIENQGNIFIVGHNGTVFKRLNEIPKSIFIYQNNQPQEHTLYNHEYAKVENIRMRDLLNFRGIVIMTCAGEYVDGHYTERLILYYK